MSYEAITYSCTDDVAVITLNRPDRMNALNRQMRLELTEAMHRAGAEARAVVLTGAGPSFCSGQDLADGGNAADLDLGKVLNEEYVPMLNSIYTCKVPVISAVNGAAAGAGANLALAADVVIATESAVFIQAFSRIGLIPDAGGTWFLPRQIGLARAMGACLFADKVTARQAVDWGMIYEAVPDADFAAHWAARAAHLAKGPTTAYQHLRTALRAAQTNSLEQQLSVEAELQSACGATHDFREGVTAFLQKRAANYTGR